MDCYIDPSSYSTIAALLSHLGLGYSAGGQKGPKALCLELVLTSASRIQLTRTSRQLVILFSNVQQLPLFFRLFTQVHLLNDGSVEGQYIIKHRTAN